MLLDGEYPETWDEFRGQERAKRQLRVAADSARRRNDRMPHTLLACPYAGMGKTALALLCAQEMDSNVRVISGAMDIDTARVVLMEMKDKDILLWDEIHMAVGRNKAKAEWMLHFLENGVLLTAMGPEPQPKVTVIGATTDAGRLPETIRGRFPSRPVMEKYTDLQAAQIAATMAGKVLLREGLPLIDAHTALAVARAATNRPRLMRQLLEQIRDLALTEEIPRPRDGRYELDLVFEFTGLTHDGLSASAVEYIHVLFHEMKGRPAGRTLLAERLGEVGKGLVETEELLTSKELIARTKQGRMLTQAGLARAKELNALRLKRAS